MKRMITTIVGLALMASSLPAMATAIPSYACVFTEPFIRIDSYPGGMRYALLDQAQEVTAVSFALQDDTVVLEGALADGKQFALAITEKPAGDGMSDILRPYAGVLTGSAVSTQLNGACLKFPDGTTPRPVANVADDDVLNVRSAPNAKAEIVNTVPPGGSVWAYPQDLQNGWARVSTALFPKGEAGTVSIVDGWVNAKFLGDAGVR